MNEDIDIIMKNPVTAAIIRVGVVGADKAGKSWAGFAHMPSLQSLSKVGGVVAEGDDDADDGKNNRLLVELTALCNSSPESAKAASKFYSINNTYHDIHDFVKSNTIDLVSVCC